MYFSSSVNNKSVFSCAYSSVSSGNYHPYRECWEALGVSILTGWTSEQAFDYVYTGKRPRPAKTTEDDIREMARLKAKGMTYKKLGEMFGMSGSTVYDRLKEGRQKQII